MAQRERYDEPDSWHHVTNRGIARRTIAESERDAHYFFSNLAEAVSAGWFEVHAFSLLSNHFHLLLYSPNGNMWRGMRLFQNGYVRWFNRANHRDGPLFRGRFHSKRIDSDSYWRAVIRYIDQNAPTARVSPAEGDYPFCSAYHYLHTTGPTWMARHVVEKTVSCDAGKKIYDPTDYGVSFSHLTEKASRLVENHLQSEAVGSGHLDYLISASPGEVRDRLLKNARLADGTEPGLPIVTAQTILEVVGEESEGDQTLELPSSRRQVDSLTYLLPGLFRLASGMSYEQVALLCDCSISTSHGRVKTHLMALRSDPDYADFSANVLRESLRRDWGTGIRRTPGPKNFTR